MKPIQILLAFGSLLLAAETAVAQDMVPTPFGHFPQECVHKHPSGAVIERMDGVTRVTHENGYEMLFELNDLCLEHVASLPARSREDAPAPAEPGTIANGWFNYTGWYPPSDIAEFTATYTVPTTPTAGADGQTLYYFIGTQDNSSTPLTILQPVLAWQGWAEGWNLSSWNCCPDGQVHHTDFTTGLQPGDTIAGTIVQTSTSPSIYDITGVWNGQSVSLSVNVGAELFNWADVTLEAYSVTECSQFSSGPMVFSDLVIKNASGDTMAPSWTIVPSGGSTACSGQLTVSSEDITIQQNN